ncbi:hypothetical protein ACVIM9_008392 [Bradyrhizobium sp. USDA 4520]
MRICGRVRQLVEPTSKLNDKALLLHAGNCRRRDACRGKLGRARNTASFNCCMCLVQSPAKRTRRLLQHTLPLSFESYQQSRLSLFDVLMVSILVDECQDCDLLQHQLVTAIDLRLPVRVYGDHPQAIFEFGEELVDWSLVEKAFSPLDRLTKPERWERAGCRKLGEWLHEIRQAIENGQSVNFDGCPKAHVTLKTHTDDQIEGE